MHDKLWIVFKPSKNEKMLQFTDICNVMTVNFDYGHSMGKYVGVIIEIQL